MSGNLTQFQWDSYSEPDLARQAKFYFSWGSNITEDQLAEMNQLQTVMESTYSTATICPYDLQAPDCEATWELEPDLVEVMASSTDYDELTYVCRLSGWRDTSRRTSQGLLRKSGVRSSLLAEWRGHWRSSTNISTPSSDIN